MKDEYDFSNSQRGKFYKPDLWLIPPVRLGSVSIDLSFLILMVSISLLMSIL